MSPSAQRRTAVILGLLALVILAGWLLRSRPPAAAKSAPVSAPAVAAPAPPSGATRPAVNNAGDQAGFHAALDEARAWRNPGQRSREFGRILREWLERDPEAALAYVRQLAPGADYTQGVLMVLESIGQKDPDRALLLARELVSTREQRAIYSSLFAQLAAADPLAAVPRLGLVPAGDSRDNALRALADGWARADFPAALAWARNLEPADRPSAMEAVLAAVIPEDPLQAIDLAQQTLTGDAFDRTLIAALQSLSRTDPQTAADLVSLLAPGEAQTQAALMVARALAAQDPTEALAWIKTLPAGEVQGYALNNILEVWAAKDPAAAGQYVLQMDPGPAQDAAAGHVSRLLAAANPLNAIAWALALASDPARELALVNIASTWAQHDPAAAARWAGSVAAPDLRTKALQGALSYWMLQDSRAAQEFILSLRGETQVHAAAYIAPGLAQQDPLAALAWAQTLPMAEAREAALAAAYARWLGNAPAAARTWLASANLPPEAKARLLGPPSN